MAITLDASLDETLRLSVGPSTPFASISFWMRFNSNTGGTQRPVSADDNWEIRTNGAIPATMTSDVLGTGTGSTSTVFQVGVWYHLTITADENANVARTYVNGVLEIDDTGNTSNGPWGVFEMGSRPFGDGIDNADISYQDIRVYDRVLTPDEALTIYTAEGHDDIIDGLVARHTFQEKHSLRNVKPFIDQQSNDLFGGSITITTPQNSNGDLLVAVIAADANNGTRPVINAPAGWIQANPGNENLPGNNNTGALHVFYKQANNDGASITFTGNGFTGTIQGVILSYEGDQFTNFTPQFATQTGNNAAPTSPSVNALTRSLIIRIFQADDNDTITSSPADTEFRYEDNIDNGGGNGCTLGIADKIIPAGASGAEGWTLANNEQWRGITLAFNGSRMPVLDISNNGNDARPIGDLSYTEGTLSLRKRRK